MGCYMSMPDNRVYVTEGKGKNFEYATASCQGWRREQEDAEACLPDFDEGGSLFVLCDGHGGAEVAKYTVEHLPDFIKNHPLYKQGKYKEALERAFVEFDALLRTDKVIEELHRLAFDEDDNKQKNKGGKVLDLKELENLFGPSSSAGTSSTKNGPSTIVDDVDTDTLRREAQVPLRELLDEYSAISGVDQTKRHNLLSRYNASPVVSAKSEDGDKNGDMDPSSSVNSVQDNQPGPSSSKSVVSPAQQGPSTSEGSESLKESLLRQVIQRYFPDEDSSDDSEFDGSDSSNDDDDDGDDEGDDEGCESSSKKLRRKKRKHQSDKPVGSSDDDSDDDGDDDDDDDDEEDDDDDDDDDDDEENDSSENDEGNGDEAADEEGDDDDQWEDVQNMLKPESRAHEPGYDSGCTVVVALIKDGKLYVASAGDSRCIMILRNGHFKAMSHDHKPEDSLERKRIMKAGGRVTEGRVNGGLNLSRAFGDFTYKSPELKASEQMITPCPDVKVADLDPEKVEYIFLACDGIWNSMKNHAATGFIREVAPAVSNNLVEICVRVFRHCIAPETDGDGTGCDNMTCIIARFDDPSKDASILTDLKTNVEESCVSEATPSDKRSSDADETTSGSKKRCLRL